MISRTSLLVASVLLLGGCHGSEEPRGRARPTPPALPARADRAPASSREATSVASNYELHEWGLLAVDVSSERTSLGLAAAGVLPPTSHGHAPHGLGGLGTFGGKPVIYVHLPAGVDEARFDLSLGVPASGIVEHWPTGSMDTGRLRFPVVARRGRCAEATEPPLPGSEACRSTADGFCEAAEIPRYHGDDDSCIEVGRAHAELLFYRAKDIDLARLPLALVRRRGEVSLEHRQGPVVEGPVFYLENEGHGTPRIVALSGNATSLTGAGQERVEPAVVRTRLLEEARRRGLTELEADAFVDAWAPAFFDHCRRQGPEASGRIPPALGPARRSLLYFVPRELVDAFLPLEADPPALASRRVFLARFVEPAREPSPANTTLGSGYAPGRNRSASAVAIDVRALPPEVRGGLAAEAVRPVVNRHLNELRFCYERGIVQNPALRGRVTINFIISPTGSVQASTVGASSLGHAGVENCIAAAVRRWSFPAPDQGVVGVRLPVNLLVRE